MDCFARLPSFPMLNLGIVMKIILLRYSTIATIHEVLHSLQAVHRQTSTTAHNTANRKVLTQKDMLALVNQGCSRTSNPEDGWLSIHQTHRKGFVIVLQAKAIHELDAWFDRASYRCTIVVRNIENAQRLRSIILPEGDDLSTFPYDVLKKRIPEFWEMQSNSVRSYVPKVSARTFAAAVFEDWANHMASVHQKRFVDVVAESDEEYLALIAAKRRKN
eukprot:PhF_6_TR3376/c0_g1_i2/m.4817